MFNFALAFPDRRGTFHFKEVGTTSVAHTGPDDKLTLQSVRYLSLFLSRSFSSLFLSLSLSLSLSRSFSSSLFCSLSFYLSLLLSLYGGAVKLNSKFGARG